MSARARFGLMLPGLALPFALGTIASKDSGESSPGVTVAESGDATANVVEREPLGALERMGPRRGALGDPALVALLAAGVPARSFSTADATAAAKADRGGAFVVCMGPRRGTPGNPALVGLLATRMGLPARSFSTADATAAAKADRGGTIVACCSSSFFFFFFCLGQLMPTWSVVAAR